MRPNHPPSTSSRFGIVCTRSCKWAASSSTKHVHQVRHCARSCKWASGSPRASRHSTFTGLSRVSPAALFTLDVPRTANIDVSHDLLATTRPERVSEGANWSSHGAPTAPKRRRPVHRHEKQVPNVRWRRDRVPALLEIHSKVQEPPDILLLRVGPR
jgi:hypothetical protein